jgi:hypothetical protein
MSNNGPENAAREYPDADGRSYRLVVIVAERSIVGSNTTGHATRGGTSQGPKERSRPPLLLHAGTPRQCEGQKQRSDQSSRSHFVTLPISNAALQRD